MARYGCAKADTSCEVCSRRWTQWHVLGMAESSEDEYIRLCGVCAQVVREAILEKDCLCADECLIPWPDRRGRLGE